MNEEAALSNGEGDFERAPMSFALQDVDVASGLVGRLEDLEAGRRGTKVSEIRPSVARRIGVTVGTLENVRKRRRKAIPSWLLNSIRRVLVDVLQAEVRALEHEIHVHLQTGVDHRSDALAQAQNQVLAARKALTEAIRIG